ncbi:hypothetical protein CVT26_014990 [Gymnopilus dilepis]|uniref:Major facilitator superfamily (MFS) profile domain-containing protein n=1 Tax=Gymnopilus dilepis TaxID=231916 RepID=A0A409YXP1_9AGAR|nr:hypothetical protein CVT26_014990 [Gymnopilus dilepis]
MGSSAQHDSRFRSSIEELDVKEHEEKIEIVPQTPMERQIALEAALKVDPGVKRFSWAAIQMYLITFVICCCSGDSGFDGTVMGGINSMKQYQDYFGMTGVGTARFQLVDVMLTEKAAYFPDKFGRRFSMFFGNAVLVIGALITATAKNKGMFLGGRLLTGLGSTCAGASAKSYLAEMAPAHSRGAYLGFLNSFYYVGQITATGMMVSTGNFASDLSWRLPLYIQLVPAAINVSFVFLCPESPRWLYSIGRADRAREILARFHSSTNDVRSPLVDLEMREIEEKIQIDGADKRWWDFRPLFTTRADRYRAYMVILIGESFSCLLLPEESLHHLNPWCDRSIKWQRTYHLFFADPAEGCWDHVTKSTAYFEFCEQHNLIGSATIDRFGRRRILLVATSVMVAILAIVTGLLSSFGSAARSNAGITFIYLFMVVFSFGWTPMQALYPAEVLSYQARAKGLAFLGIVSQIATLINTFGLPVALQKIGWKVYLIFLIWDVFEVIVMYFVLVETKGFTLEEINEVFEAVNPRQYSEQLLKERQEVRKGQSAVA